MTANVPLWQPSPERIAKANITAFARLAEDVAGRPLPDYGALWKWSNDEREAFWRAAVGLRRRHRRARRAHAGRRRPDARRALVSRRTTQLRRESARRAAAPTMRPTRSCSAARIAMQRRLTHGELRDQASRVAAALRAMGLRTGDRVAAYVPNMPEAIIAMLGATRQRRRLVVVLAGFRRARRARPLRPDRAARARHGRRLLVQRQGAADRRQGRARSSRAADRRARRRHSLSRAVRRGRSHVSTASAARSRWDDFLAPHAPGPIDYARLPFDHPALHPLFVGHDRRAEVHRPRRRRHAAAAPEGASAARRSQSAATACSISRPAAG